MKIFAEARAISGSSPEATRAICATILSTTGSCIVTLTRLAALATLSRGAGEGSYCADYLTLSRTAGEGGPLAIARGG
jgi:hypothetical protein